MRHKTVCKKLLSAILAAATVFSSLSPAVSIAEEKEIPAGYAVQEADPAFGETAPSEPLEAMPEDTDITVEEDHEIIPEEEDLPEADDSGTDGGLQEETSDIPSLFEAEQPQSVIVMSHIDETIYGNSEIPGLLWARIESEEGFPDLVSAKTEILSGDRLSGKMSLINPHIHCVLAVAISLYTEDGKEWIPAHEEGYAQNPRYTITLCPESPFDLPSCDLFQIRSDNSIHRISYETSTPNGQEGYPCITFESEGTGAFLFVVRDTESENAEENEAGDIAASTIDEWPVPAEVIAEEQTAPEEMIIEEQTAPAEVIVEEQTAPEEMVVEEQTAPEEMVVEEQTATAEGGEATAEYSILGGQNIKASDLLQEIYADDYQGSIENVEKLEVVEKPDTPDFGIVEVNETVEGAEKDWDVAAVVPGDQSLDLSGNESVIAATYSDGTVNEINVRVGGTPKAESGVSGDGTSVCITSADGVYLPEEAQASAELLRERKADAAVRSVDELADADHKVQYRVFDISLDHVDENEYDGFNVQLTLPEELTGRQFRLFHVHTDENGKEITEELSMEMTGTGTDPETGLETVSEIQFTTEGFSKFILSYTVDFHYQGYEFNLTGNGWMTLSDLVSRLNLIDQTTGSVLNMADVKTADFTDPSLLRVVPAPADASLAQLRQSAGLPGDEAKYPDEDKIVIVGPDYVLFSLKPFRTQEKLTVAMQNGDTYVIDVADEMGDVSAAVELRLGVLASLASSSSDTEQYFSFVPPYNHEYSFAFSNLNSNNTHQFVCYDSEGDPKYEESYKGSSPKTYTWDLNAGETYYIGIKKTAGSRTIIPSATPTLGSHAGYFKEDHICTCGCLEPWYIEDGVLHIQTDDEAMDYSSVARAPWYSKRSEITSIVVEEGVTKVPNNFVGSSNGTYYPNLISVILPDSVTSIGTNSFYNCTALKSIELGTGIKTIPENAFRGCSSLDAINLDNVTSIGVNAFSGCRSLTDVDLSSVTSIGSYAFQNCNTLNPLEFGERLTSIGASAFSGCSSIDSLLIPASVSAIGKEAFNGCTSLGSVAFSNENLMTELSEGVFQGCTGLEEIVLPQDLSKIGASALKGCKSLSEVSFPSSLEIIDTSAFEKCESLERADLPGYLTDIGNSAFFGCKALAEANYPSSLKKIGEKAYAGCESLGTVEVPEGVETIGNEAFQGCTGLEEASIKTTSITKLPESIFSGCSALNHVEIPESVTDIGANALNGCTSLTAFRFPENIQTIGNSAFLNCSGLKVLNGEDEGDFVIPSTVLSIGLSAFQGCSGMVSVEVPDSVTALGGSAFANCANLETAVIGSGINQLPASLFSNDPKLKTVIFRGKIEEIPNDAFNGCTGLENFPLWEGLKRIGNNAFQGCTSLAPVLEFPPTLESVGSSAYEGCTRITEAHFKDGDSPLTIGSKAFYQLTKLTEVDLPDNLVSIGSEAFRGCSNLETVHLSDSLTSIGASAFRDCKKVERFDLPDSLKTIGNYAFQNCSEAEFSGMPDHIETIGNYAFRYCYKITELEFPASLKTIGNSAFYGAENTTSTSPKISSVTFEEGCELTSIGTYAFSGQKMTQIVLPDKLQTIGGYAFQYCGNLEQVDLPDSLKTIGNSAFYYDSRLKSIVIPNSVTSIGTYCFYNCSGLADVTLSEALTSIPDNAFQSCTSLKEIEIPDGVTAIKESAFYGCNNLREVDFPDNLTSIGSSAFYGCVMLEQALLPDQVTTISGAAFSGCSELKTVRIPPAITSITSTAFDNCRSLENLIWDVPSREITIPSMTGVPNFTLTLGQAVDSISRTTLETLVKRGAEHLIFEGENYLTLPSTSGLKLPRPLNNLEAGSYYADAQGALYQIKDDGTATLVYVPDGLETYTIPAGIPQEGGEGTIPVTGVKDNAFALAQALTSVTVTSPESMTNIASFAFAYAANLESVNGQTTIEGALNLFTNEAKGVQVFYKTKLTAGQEPKSQTEGLLYDARVNEEDQQKGWSNTLRVSITQEQDKARRGLNGTRDQVGPMDTDPSTGAYLVYTGEEVVTSIEVSNEASEGIVEGDKVRVYFQIDDGGGINKTVGGAPFYIRAESQTGESSEADDVMVSVVGTEAKGVFYIEFARPANGKTLTLDVKMNFPSPTTEGGNAVVWAEYFGPEEAEQTKGQARPPQEKRQTVNWTTKRDEYKLTKTANTNEVLVTVDGSGTTYIKGNTFVINLSRVGDTLEGVGKDNMKSADFTDTLILPEGVFLNPVIREEILAGKIRYSGSGTTSMTAVSPTLGTIASFSLLSLPASSRTGIPVLGVDDEGRLVFTWRTENLNPNRNEDAAEISVPRLTMTVYDKVLCMAPGIAANTPYTIRNQVDVTEHYCYSSDWTRSAAAEYTANSGAAGLSLEKTAVSGIRGEYAPYTIKLKSTGVLPITNRELTSLSDVIDSTDKMHYLDAAGIWEMLHNGLYKEALTIRIDNATLYGGSGTEALLASKMQVLTTDGETKWTDQSNTGYETHYSGTYGLDRHAVTGYVFTFCLNEENALCYTLKNSQGVNIADGTLASADAIQQMFDAQGFFVTKDTLYTVSWDFENKVPDLSILGGQTVEILIPTRFKDSFMHLNSDRQGSDTYSASNGTSGDTYLWSNTARAVFNGTDKNASATARHGNDVSISKGKQYIESHRYQDDYTDLEIPDVVEYSIGIAHHGSTFYDVMPVTDHMTKMQVMLVPVEQNAGKSWTAGLETRDVDGTAYYVLNREGTYEDVQTGNARADRIVVQKKENSENEYDTKIFWYVRNFGGERSYSLRYKAAVIQGKIIPLEPAFDLYNETWIGDHDAHRLWAQVVDGDYYRQEPVVQNWDKRIVDHVGDTSAGYDYCNITRGKQVIYRLSFVNETRKDFTITGKDIYDILPRYSSQHKWSKSNIRLVYQGFETNDPDGTKWNITTHSTASNEQKIVWSDDFVMTCTDPNGIAYLYVIADFPDGTSWEDYVQKCQNSILYNTLRLRNDGVSFDQRVVTHDLADHMRIRLQKGVYATGGVIPQGSGTTDIYNSGEDSRLAYENNDTMRRKAYYYITLHNDSYTNLYLNPLQDILPRGFTFCKASVADSSFATVSGGRVSSSYVPAWYSSVDVSQEGVQDGRQRIRLELHPGINSSDKQYNKRVGRYYLAPAQTMVIRVECYTNNVEDTGDTALNSVAMPYYDLYNQGADIDDSVSTSVGNTSNTGSKKNDGDCELMDTVQAQALGFNTADANAATQWLYSEVTLIREAIQPGLIKTLRKKIMVNSDGIESAENYPSSISPTDRLVWEVTAFDNSLSSIMDYAVTDDLPAPYNFSGDVNFRQVFNDAGTQTDPETLFTIVRETQEGANRRIIVSDTVRLLPGGAQDQEPVTLLIGGDPVEMEIPVETSGVSGEKDSLKLEVSINRRSDNGNEVLSIHFMDEEDCIPAGGKIVIDYSCENLSGILENKMILNTAFVTPLKQTWDGTVSEGNVTDYVTPYSSEFAQSVRNSAQIVESYGGTTTSIKRIEEKAAPANRTDSEKEVNYITIPDRENEFVYSLSVSNDNASPIKKIVMIDNLPQEGDHSVFQQEDPRYSAFLVMLADNPAFSLTVEAQDGTRKTVLDANYRIELGTKTEFNEMDWKGDASSDWTELDGSMGDEERLSLIRQARSIRLVFLDEAEDYYDNVFLPDTKLILSFTAVIDPDDEKAQPGTIAWNGFGYHYTIKGRVIDQEAAPLLVGVRIPEYPSIKKRLIDARQHPFVAEYNEDFTYVIYEGSALNALNSLTGKTGEQIIREIEKGKRNYVTVDIRIPRGRSEAEHAESLNGRTGRMWNSTASAYEDAAWKMTNGKKYQVIELPAGRYESYSINNTRGSRYAFTWQMNQKALEITGVNMHDDWSLHLEKTDQFRRPVGDAVFAVYSPVEEEAWIQEPAEEADSRELKYTSEKLKELYEGKTPEELSEAFGVTLQEKPAYEMTQDDLTFRLMAIVKTKGYGAFSLDNLKGDHYLYQEISAPADYAPDGSVHMVSRAQTDTHGIITASAVNEYRAEGSIRLKAVKELSGRPLKAGEFHFLLQGFDNESGSVISQGSGMPPMPQTPDGCSASNDSEGTAVFGEIKFTQNDIGKDYYYLITESVPQQRPPHVTYDDSRYVAKVTVTDLGEGELGADVRYLWINDLGQEIASEQSDLAGGAVFRNEYRYDTEVSLKAKKILKGRDWREGETFAFRLTGTPDPDDETCPVDGRSFTKTVSEDNPTAQFTILYDAGYNEQTWHYSLGEVVPADAVGYDRTTGLPVQVPRVPGGRTKVNMTYARYSSMEEEERNTLTLPADEDIMWKRHGVAYDAALHEVVVSLHYDEETGTILTDMSIDGKKADTGASADPVQITFTNTFVADNKQAVIPVSKSIEGRPWLRNDAYGFSIFAEEGTPMPQDKQILIERGPVNDNPARSGRFTISYRWDDLRNADGTYAREKEFFYSVREMYDPEDEEASLSKDGNGNVTSYKRDQITYDLHEEQVKVVLTDNEDGTMGTAVFFRNPEGEWEAAGSGSAAFVNSYAEEPIGFPLRVRKEVNDTVGAGEGTYSFALFDTEGNPVLDEEDNPVVVTVSPGEEEDGTVEQYARLALTDAEDGSAKVYDYVLREVIPGEAIAYAQGQQVLLGGEDPLRYGDYSSMTQQQKEALSLPAENEMSWKLDGVTYSTEQIVVKVKVTLNRVTYRLESDVSYQPDPEHDKVAVFYNSYEASGNAVLKVGKTFDGRGFREGEAVAFEVIPVDEAPLRTGNGPEVESLRGNAGEDKPAIFKPSYTLDDLVDADGKWTPKHFRYRIHECVPDGAQAYNLRGEALSENGVVMEEGDTALVYRSAAPEQKHSSEILWKYQGITYAQDQFVTVHVSDRGDGTLDVTYGGTRDPETGAWSGTVSGTAELAFTNHYETTPAQTSLYVQKQIRNAEGNIVTGWKTGENPARDWSEKEFFFTLSAADPQAPMPAGFSVESGVRSKTVKLDRTRQKDTFGAMSFDRPGVWTYTVKERRRADNAAFDTAHDEGGSGEYRYVLAYDIREYQVTVTVTDNLTGALEAAVQVEEAAGALAGQQETMDEPADSGEEPGTTAADAPDPAADGSEAHPVLFLNQEQAYACRNLTVQKTVRGNMGSRSRAFDFTLRLTRGENGFFDVSNSVRYEKKDSSGTITRGTIQLVDGVCGFKLAHGDSITFREIPYDTEYEVKESDESRADYQVSVEGSNDTGRITDEDVSVSFVNTRNMGVPTSADTRSEDTWRMLALFLFAAVIMMIYLGRKRRI